MENAAIVSTLNRLIEISRDGDHGFSACADDAQSPSLRAYFTICATRCREAVRILSDLVARHNGTPSETGTVAGSAHRAWVNLRSALTDRDDVAVLEECERGEDVALRAYRAAMQEGLPPEIAAVVQKQLEGVQENHDRVKALRDEQRRLAA